MTKARKSYGISHTPGGGLLRDDSGKLVRYNNLADAEAEAMRLTRVSYDNPKIAGVDYTPVELPD
jgi:hypothetical protein